jgi:hypothetical protein
VKPPAPPPDTAPIALADQGRRWSQSRIEALCGGAVFLATGLALVVHVLTGTPLPLAIGVLVVAGTALAYATLGTRSDAAARARMRGWWLRVRVGVAVGLLSTLVYDASRWLLVEVGGFRVSPFKAFPFFGEALLGLDRGATAAVAAGVVFHLFNGAAFGVAYTLWFGGRSVWWGIGFGLGLEAAMLTIYPGWLDIRAISEFGQMSVFGHVAYGVSLSLVSRRLLAWGTR